MNKRAAWMAVRVLFLAIGAMSTVAYIAAMPHWLIVLALGVLAGAFTLLYKMICELEGSSHDGVSSEPATKAALAVVAPAPRPAVPGRSSRNREARPLLPTLRESHPNVGGLAGTDVGGLGLEPLAAIVADAISALENLGYSQADARYAVTRVRMVTTTLDDDFNGLVRAALDDLHLRRAS